MPLNSWIYDLTGTVQGGGIAPPGPITDIQLDPIDYSEPGRVIITGTAQLPVPYNNFDGCETWVGIPGEMPGPGGHHYHYPPDTTTRHKIFFDLPRPSEDATFRLWFVSRNADVDAQLKIEAGEGQTPYIDVPISAQPPVGPDEPPGNITMGAPSPAVYLPADASGGVRVRFTFPYEPPDPIGTFDRVHLYMQAYDDASKKASIGDDGGDVGGFIIPETATGPDADTSFLVPTVERKYMGKVMYDPNEKILTITDLAPNERQYWRVYGVSGSPSLENKLITADEANPTPNQVVTVDPPPAIISGAEYAPNAASFSLVGEVEYYQGDGGRWLWYATVTWTNPDADPNIGALAGYDVVVAYHDEQKTREVDASVSLNAAPHTLDDRNVPFGQERVDLQLISYDRHGNRNTPIDGVTPTIPLTIELPLGGPGNEYAPNITNPSVTHRYTVSGPGQPVLEIDTAFTKPHDARYQGVRVYAHTPEQPPIPPLPGPLTGIEWKSSTHSELLDMPATGLNWDFYFIAAGYVDRENSYQDGTAPGSVATPKVTHFIPAYFTEQPVPPVTGFAVDVSYDAGGADGQRRLVFMTQFTAPASRQWSYIELWVRRGAVGTPWEYLGDISLPGALLYSSKLPTVGANWLFRGITKDSNNKDANGNATSDPAAPPPGTPEYPKFVDTPFAVAPIANVTGFSVVAEYSSGDYYGRRVLLLYPRFDRPPETNWAYVEFWGKREDGKWYHYGNPSSGTVAASTTTDKAVVDSLPAVTFLWTFAAIPNDVNGMDRDGKQTSDPAAPPAGTATCTLNIPKAEGTLDGTKIDGITAAAFAAGIKPVELIGPGYPHDTLASVGLPKAEYPVGTPVFVTNDTPEPKMYRVAAGGATWTAVSDGRDLITASVIAGKVAAGAIGTTELFAGEILVGQGAGKPTRFKIVDSSSNMIGFWGDDPSIPFLGMFTTRLKIAPTIQSLTPMINADLSAGGTGKIEMVNVGLDIRYANSKLVTSPQTFDATYTSSVAMVIEDTVTVEKCVHVTRGMVCFASGLQAAALVKGSGNWGELVLYATGTLKIHLNGNTGIVRGDGGIQVGGSIIINSSGAISSPSTIGATGQMSASSLVISGGIQCGSASATGQINAGTGLQVAGIECISSGRVFKPTSIRYPEIYPEAMPSTYSGRVMYVHDTNGTLMGKIMIYS